MCRVKRNRMNMACFLNAGLSKNFWEEAVNMTCFLINRSLRAALDRKVIEEV